MSERAELPRAESCETCRFWDAKGYGLNVHGQEYSDCHRHPPAYLGGDQSSPHSYGNPVVYAEHWCGEWKPIPEQIPTVAPPALPVG